MTRASAIADILKKLGDAHYQAADELIALAADDSPAPVSAGRPEAAAIPPAVAPASFDSSDYGDGPQGSEAICPKHRVPYADGAYGPYCKQRTDDPAWGKEKGDTMWCRITPKNAAQYLRVQAAA